MLDADRQRRAGGRARAAAEEQAYHEGQARAAKARCDQLIEIWDLDPVTFQPNDKPRVCDGCGKSQAECPSSCGARQAGGWER